VAQGGIAFIRITKALILVNDGVGACLTSCDYTDMIAHETGHTIGAGHSNVSSALMAPIIVRGRCGAFQADDVDFAQCAYEGTPSTCQKLPPFITSVTPAITKRGKVRAVVNGRRFTKGTKVEIDSGSGFVQAPKTRWKSKRKVIGLNVGAIWPAGVPVTVRVVRKATDCASNEIVISR